DPLSRLHLHLEGEVVVHLVPATAAQVRYRRRARGVGNQLNGGRADRAGGGLRQNHPSGDRGWLDADQLQTVDVLAGDRNRCGNRITNTTYEPKPRPLAHADAVVARREVREHEAPVGTKLTTTRDHRDAPRPAC